MFTFAMAVLQAKTKFEPGFLYVAMFFIDISLIAAIFGH